MICLCFSVCVKVDFMTRRQLFGRIGGGSLSTVERREVVLQDLGLSKHPFLSCDQNSGAGAGVCLCWLPCGRAGGRQAESGRRGAFLAVTVTWPAWGRVCGPHAHPALGSGTTEIWAWVSLWFCGLFSYGVFYGSGITC